MHLLLILTLCAVIASPAAASDLNILGGIIRQFDAPGSSYTGQIEYRGSLLRDLGYGVSYLNEGHLDGGHRDGYLAQIWGELPLGGRVRLGAGIGPYLFFNTTRDSCQEAYCNSHGVGGATSAALTFQAEGDWLFHLRANWIITKDTDTFASLIGVGYRFGKENQAPAPATRPNATPKNAVTLLAGQTTVNSFSSEHAAAFALEYRRHLLPWLDWTAGWLYEGDAHVIRRSGVHSQLWATARLLDDTLSVGIGGGAYLAADNYSHEPSRDTEPLAGIAALTAACRLDGNWQLRSTWYRVVTGYNGDTDVILGGIGYTF